MKIGALILAGGLGTRVGSQNKGLLPLHNKPMIEHIIERLQPQVDYLAISVNTQLEHYQTYHLPLFNDQTNLQQQGPLAGIASACPHFPSDLTAIQVVPCDTPFLPHDLVARLHQALMEEEDYQIAYAATEAGIQPSIFLFKPTINQHLIDHIQTGQRSLKSWLFKHNCIKVPFEQQPFININDLNTLHQLNQED